MADSAAAAAAAAAAAIADVSMTKRRVVLVSKLTTMRGMKS